MNVLDRDPRLGRERFRCSAAGAESQGCAKPRMPGRTRAFPPALLSERHREAHAARDCGYPQRGKSGERTSQIDRAAKGGEVARIVRFSSVIEEKRASVILPPLNRGAHTMFRMIFAIVVGVMEKTPRR